MNLREEMRDLIAGESTEGKFVFDKSKKCKIFISETKRHFNFYHHIFLFVFGSMKLHFSPKIDILFRQINAKTNLTKLQPPISAMAKVNLNQEATSSQERITLLVDSTRFYIEPCKISSSFIILLFNFIFSF
jgi:hypothetical protein